MMPTLKKKYKQKARGLVGQWVSRWLAGRLVGTAVKQCETTYKIRIVNNLF